MILAGDIGGTKTLLGLFDPDTRSAPPRLLRSYPSRDYPSLESVLSRFLDETRPLLPDTSVDGAAFGVAGPVIAGRCQTTNLPWTIESATLARVLGIPPTAVALANDLVSIAWGTTVAPPSSLRTVNSGSEVPDGTRVIIAPGTGLGEAIIGMHEGVPVPLPTEGGHSDWAPTCPEEIPLLEWLWNTFGHASPERLLSGPGIALLYHFHIRTRPADPPPLPQDLPDDKIPEALSKEAQKGNPVALSVMKSFWKLLAAEAGNMALKTFSTGGVILAGGIPEKVFPFLDKAAFMESFTAKGRYRDLLSKIPVRIASDPDIGLKGAAEIARRLSRLTGESERSSL